jgi:hypothetical protein
VGFLDTGPLVAASAEAVSGRCDPLRDALCFSSSESGDTSSSSSSRAGFLNEVLVFAFGVLYEESLSVEALLLLN